MFVRKGSKIKFFDVVTCKEFTGEVMTIEKRMERKHYWVKDEEERLYRIEKWQMIRKIKESVQVPGKNPPPTTPKPPIIGSSVQKDSGFFTEKCKECLFFRTGGGK